ncbi:MAG: magnesium transporter CorA family protein [Caldimonas sp.]
MPQPVRVFHIVGDQFTELAEQPEQIPKDGYLWIATTRTEFEASLVEVQGFLQRWTGAQLFELHVLDLLNRQLPSAFDYTSAYDLLVFRRLAAGVVDKSEEEIGKAAPPPRRTAIEMIDTSAVGFAIFDRVLLTVHPTDCQVREFFALRLKTQTAGFEGRASARMPTSPADLMLRMVNYMVDSFLELRRQLGKRLDDQQQQLFDGKGLAGGWHQLLDSRNALHLLEDTCEDQRAAIVEWIDALEEWPAEKDAALRREREQLRVRSRDVLEHIERVLSHVRRLESSSETAVQMHFSEQSNRTNNIMRALTVLTAIFLPLNLVTGFFGMNFEGLPLIHSARGFWVIFLLMLTLGVGMSIFFWRKRYLR